MYDSRIERKGLVKRKIHGQNAERRWTNHLDSHSLFSM